jgi:hypothetical protein
MELSALEYWRGVLLLAAISAAVLWGVVRLRRRLVPSWTGPLARTVEATLATGVVLGTAQLLALVRQLRPGVTMVAVGALGLLIAALGAGPGEDRSSDGRRPSPLRLLAIGASAAVFAQWTAVTAMAFHGGMTQPDTLWYHGPFTARFLQERTLGDLERVGYSAARYFPLDNELLHALVAMPFRSSDLVSPVVNLGFLAMAIVAAAAVGQTVGRASLGVLGALVGLSFPALVAVDAGAASSDVPAAAFLMAAVAMLLATDDLEPTPVALGGLATGLALGFKLTVAVPVAVLTAGVLVLALRRRALAPALLWTGGLVAGAGAWFVRNLALTGSPLPYFDVSIGPLQLEAAATQDGPPLLDTLFDGSAWRDVYLPAFDGSIGRAWPLVLAGAVLVVLVALLRGPAAGKVGALAVAAAAVGHVVTPMTGGFVFENNLRYLHPALALGGALLPVALARARPVVTGAAALAAGGLVVVNLASPDKTGFHRWPSEHRPLAVTVGVALALVVAAALTAVASGRWSVRRLLPIALAGGTAALVVVGAIGHEGYADRRYQETELARIALYAPFADVRGQRVASVGHQDVYPLFGPDLSNHVERYTQADRRADVEPCLAWRELLAEGFDFLVVSAPYFLNPMDLHLDELVGDPAAEQIVRTELGAVYRVEGRLDTAECNPRAQG